MAPHCRAMTLIGRKIRTESPQDPPQLFLTSQYFLPVLASVP